MHKFAVDVVDEKVPVGQEVQDEARGAEYVPAEQATHDDLSEFAAYPAVHAVHDDDPITATVPDEQFRQLVWPIEAA